LSAATWITRPARRSDWEAWRRLFAGYCAFYETPTSEAHQRVVWSWIHDDGAVEAIVAVPADEPDGEPVGLAHLRPWVRPLHGEICGYLDDLFVDPAVRGGGAVQALFAAVETAALDHGWSMVRWTTADDNYRARSVYDRCAVRTGWITYQLTPGSKST
jgi:RimJ/RimL family protein N-acetyltransferase